MPISCQVATIPPNGVRIKYLTMHLVSFLTVEPYFSVLCQILTHLCIIVILLIVKIEFPECFSILQKKKYCEFCQLHAKSLPFPQMVSESDILFSDISHNFNNPNNSHIYFAKCSKEKFFHHIKNIENDLQY